MSAAEQLTLDGGAVRHPPPDPNARGSRILRRFELGDGGPISDGEALEWMRVHLERALDAARVMPGEAFYVSRVPPRVDAPASGGVRRSDPSTSRRAAADVAPRTGSQRAKILDVFAGDASGIAHLTWPGRPLTAEQACRIAGIPGGWRRVSELVATGYLAPTGAERANASGSDAEVLELTAKGRADVDRRRAER